MQIYFRHVLHIYTCVSKPQDPNPLPKVPKPNLTWRGDKKKHIFVWYTEDIPHVWVLPLYHIPGLLLKVQTTEKTWNPKTGKEIGDISKNQEPSKVGYISLSTISDSKLTGKNCSTLNSKSSTGKIMLRKVHTWFINMQWAMLSIMVF